MQLLLHCNIIVIYMKFDRNISISARPQVNIPDTGRRTWIVGTNVDLSCIVTGLANPRIRWSRQDGLPLPQGHAIRGNILYLSNIQREDAGVYVCSASGDGIDSWIDTTIQFDVRGETFFQISVQIIATDTIATLFAPEIF